MSIDCTHPECRDTYECIRFDVEYKFGQGAKQIKVSRSEADFAYYPRNLPTVIGDVEINLCWVWVWNADRESPKTLKVWW